MTPANARALQVREETESGETCHADAPAARVLAFDRTYGLDAENDPSPVGFHESSLTKTVRVEGFSGHPPTDAEITTYLDTGRVVLTIVAPGLMAHERDGAVDIELTHRGMLDDICEIAPYARDRAEANGLLDHLPNPEHFDPRVARRAARISYERAEGFLAHVDEILERGGDAAEQIAALRQVFQDQTIPRADDPQVTHLTAVVTALRNILDAPAPGALLATINCSCPDCTTARASAFHCVKCGFRGVPLVHGCLCPERFGETVELLTKFAANQERTGNAAIAAEYRADAAAILARGSDAICDGHDSRLSADDCMHKLIECPRCLGGDVEYAIDLIAPFARMKALQSIFDQHDAGAPIVAFDPFDNESDSDSDGDDDAAETTDDRADTVDDETPAAAALLRAVSRMETREYQDFHHNGETFRMFITIPERYASSIATAADRVAIDAQTAWLDELASSKRAAAEIELVELNGAFLRAASEIAAGRGAWEWHFSKDSAGKFRRGFFTDLDAFVAAGRDCSSDTHQSLTKLQEQYHDQLSDGSIIPYDDGGVFLTDKRAFDSPGLYGEHGVQSSGEVEFNVVLGGRTNGKSGDERRFEPDINVCVTDDRTLQALVADFLEGVYDRYCVTASDPAATLPITETDQGALREEDPVAEAAIRDLLAATDSSVSRVEQELRIDMIVRGLRWADPPDGPIVPASGDVTSTDGLKHVALIRELLGILQPQLSDEDVERLVVAIAQKLNENRTPDAAAPDEPVDQSASPTLAAVRASVHNAALVLGDALIDSQTGPDSVAWNPNAQAILAHLAHLLLSRVRGVGDEERLIARAFLDLIGERRPDMTAAFSAARSLLANSAGSDYAEAVAVLKNMPANA